MFVIAGLPLTKECQELSGIWEILSKSQEMSGKLMIF